MSEAELKKLFHDFCGGKSEAFTMIYTELKKPVFTIAYRITGQKESAEDITQELFIKLYSSPPSTTVKNMRAWIFRMARNLAIDLLRKKQCSDFDDITISVQDTESINVRLDIEKAIATLSLIEREIISLHLDGDLGFRQIADALGLSTPAVYRKYKGALNTLRKKLDGGN